ncbi:cobalamin-dependent protein [bacterium]|nr:cobalamin-dependent protein [bacterium]
MEKLIEQLSICIESGKINRNSGYPPQLKGQDGADEIARQALESGIKPSGILEGCMAGMQRIGERFGRNEVFVPELLMAAKAMNTVMEHLKPYFQTGEVKRRGVFVVGTVAGDLHDIGKKLVAMVVEGNGWEVIDLGVDVSTEKFMETVGQKPGCAVGLSALLTTTMVNMEKTVKFIRDKYPQTKILVGGAPVTLNYANQIGADGYAPDPQGAVHLLDRLAS